MTPAGRSSEDIVAWLRAAVAAELHLDPGSLDPDRVLTFYGLDSLTAATLAGDLAEWLGRPLSDDVLMARATMRGLAGRLAQPTAHDRAHHHVPRRPRASDPIDYATLDYTRSPGFERMAKAIIRVLVKMTTDLHVEGLDQVPAAGPALVASNHLHILDAVWMLGVLPRRTILLVAEEFERKPVVGWLLNAARVIYISRGTADRGALDQAVVVLKHGGTMTVAPEGKLSRTGGLIRGHSGIAFLATESGVPVTPAVLWGQERAWSCWFRLRRVRVDLRFGEPVRLPAGPAGHRELRRYTDQIMRALAALLPEVYRGVYK